MRSPSCTATVMAERPDLPAEPGWPATASFRGVRLAPFRRRDLGAWREVRERNRGWLSRWDATHPPGSRWPVRSYAGMVALNGREARAGRMLPWLVWLDRPGQRGVMAGQLTVSGITYGAAQWASLGYWVDQRWAGRGIMPTAVALATDYCLQTLGLHRVEINVRPENLPSLRVVEKLGFRYEGRRPRFLHIDGDWRDHECFALHAEEVPDGVCRRLPPDVPRLVS